MKTAVLFLALGALLAFSGCNDLSGPESTVASSYTAVQKGDFATFLSTLSGDALASYGNKTAMASLQQTLQGTDPRIGSVKKLSEGANSDGSGWTTTYDVTVVSGDSANAKLILDLNVICQTTEEGSGVPCIGGNPAANPTGCTDTSSPASYPTFCSIDTITVN